MAHVACQLPLRLPSHLKPAQSLRHTSRWSCGLDDAMQRARDGRLSELTEQV